MTKTENNLVKSHPRKTSKSKQDLAEVADVDKVADSTKVDKKVPTGETPSEGLSAKERQVLCRVGAKILTSVQVNGSVSIPCPDNKAIDLALKYGAQGLVDEFAPADAVESTLAPVIVGIRNAVMTSLNLATEGPAERRDIELNTAFKGVDRLAQLLERFDSHRGHGNRRVTVGNVNVESGAQAIVGNVETTPRQEPGTEDSTIKPNKPKPRAP